MFTGDASRWREGMSEEERRQGQLAKDCLYLLEDKLWQLPFAAEDRDQLPEFEEAGLMEFVGEFRKILDSEQEGDDEIVANVLRKVLSKGTFAKHRPYARERWIRFLSESSIFMNERELDELKRFAVDFYESAVPEYTFPQRERKTLFRTLRDGIQLAEEMQTLELDGKRMKLQAYTAEDDAEARELARVRRDYEALVERLQLEEDGEVLRTRYSFSFDAGRELSERDRGIIREIFTRQTDPQKRAVLAATGLRFWNTDFLYLSTKQRELQRLKEEGVAIEEPLLIRENVKALVGALLRKESSKYSHKFSQLFPVKEGVKKEFVEEVFQDACNMLAQALPASLKDGEARYKNMAWYMGSIFSSLRGLVRDFEDNMYWSRRDAYEKQFLAAVNQGSGEEYSRWKIAYESGNEYVPRNVTVAAVSTPEQPVVREREPEREQVSAVVTSASAGAFDSRPLREPDAVVPVAVPQIAPVHERPLVISPRRDDGGDRERSMDRDREPPVDFEERREGVLARIEAGGLVNLAAELNKHSDPDVINDVHVQVAARAALQRMLEAGNFGVVKKAAPVFLGENWRNDIALRGIALHQIVSQRAAHIQHAEGFRLPLSVLELEARDFGFVWADIEAEAKERPKMKVKRKK